MPGYDRKTKIKATPLPAFKAASLVVTGERMVGGMREISLRLHSPASADYINLLFASDAGITAASVNGFPVATPSEQVESTQQTEQVSAMKEKDKTRADNWWRWRWYGLPDDGADIVLTLKPGKTLQMKIVEIDYGLPADAPQRPLDSMPKPYTWSDSTVIFQTIEL
ncbi:MAG: hypothetical protein L3J22_04675 [Xanthomonadales bacterium]|nr:hypothetical protein [Xanthomonadales bacterium]